MHKRRRRVGVVKTVIKVSEFGKYEWRRVYVCKTNLKWERMKEKKFGGLGGGIKGRVKYVSERKF